MSDNAAIEKKIEELEAEMARTQKNKATNYHLVCPVWFIVLLWKSVNTRSSRTKKHRPVACIYSTLTYLSISNSLSHSISKSFFQNLSLRPTPIHTNNTGNIESENSQVKERIDPWIGGEIGRNQERRTRL
jgi:hypothetical protein